MVAAKIWLAKTRAKSPARMYLMLFFMDVVLMRWVDFRNRAHPEKRTDVKTVTSEFT